MKKTLSFITLLVSFILTTTTSCNKGDEPTPQTIDSIKSVLPKQITILPEDSDSMVVSFKYDTLNHKVELYQDDPSTPDLYDQLLITSTFNSDGYLVNYIINTNLFDDTFNNAIVNISRASDNKINYIAYNDLVQNRKDTSNYTYETTPNGTQISVAGYYAYFEETLTHYNYDNQNKLISYSFEEDPEPTAQFSYNSNNSVSKIVKTGDFANVSEFSYTSGIADDKEDLLGRILLGKDYYLWDLKELSPFTEYLDADYDDYPISLTDPYHFTRMLDTHRPDASPTGIEGLSVAYELNQNKLLSKITVTWEADSQSPAYTIIMKLKY